MERIMEQLETRCYDGLQEAMKKTEGIGIEYDEDVVCDICRSVCYLHCYNYAFAANSRWRRHRVSRPTVHPLSVVHSLTFDSHDMISLYLVERFQ